jgi:hypothetical protein
MIFGLIPIKLKSKFFLKSQAIYSFKKNIDYDYFYGIIRARKVRLFNR